MALLAGMMIIPAVYVFSGTDDMTSGPSLMFVSLPKVFDAMGGAGDIVGLVFFVMVAFAALTSSVSIMETLVAGCMSLFHTATWRLSSWQSCSCNRREYWDGTKGVLWKHNV